VERLEASRNYWICTARPDGRAHAMPVWGLWRDDGVLFSSSPSSMKAQNIEHEPRIVVHLESGDEVVVLEGEAQPVSLVPDTAAAYDAKYGFPPDPDNPDGIWLHVRPTRAFAWVEADYPHTATRFDWKD
jgi:general stress protein 26